MQSPETGLLWCPQRMLCSTCLDDPLVVSGLVGLGMGKFSAEFAGECLRVSRKLTAEAGEYLFDGDGESEQGPSRHVDSWLELLDCLPRI